MTDFIDRALDWFEGHDIDAKRLMTDDAFSYVHNRSLRELLAARAIERLRAQAYRPGTDGKVRALPPRRSGAIGIRHDLPLKPHRDRDLPHWLDYYDDAATLQIGNQPPVGRVHNLIGRTARLRRSCR